MATLILIAGGSGAGKSTMAELVRKKFKDSDIAVFSQDNYYHDISHFSEDELAFYNFDHPDSIDHKQLIIDIKQMLENQEVWIPEYDFVTHKRKERAQQIKPVDVVIVEGIFILYYTELAKISDLSLFVDTDADLRLVRRLRRDVSERGFSLEEALERYLQTVKPMHETFIEPSKKHADIIIPGAKSFEKAMQMLDGYFVNKLVEEVYTDRT